METVIWCQIKIFRNCYLVPAKIFGFSLLVPAKIWPSTFPPTTNRIPPTIKRLEKLLFAATNDATIDGIAHRCNGFCFHILKIVSWRPQHPRKNRDIHIVGFFSYILFIVQPKFRWQIIFCFLFLNRGPMCISGVTADGTNFRVAFYPGPRLTAPFWM